MLWENTLEPDNTLNSKIFSTLMASFGVALIAESAGLAGAEPNALVPSFVAQGNISRTAYRLGESNPYDRVEANVSFYYSNGWWEVQIKYLNSPKRHPSMQSCMRIPDGTRCYTLFAGDSRSGMTTAEVCPSAFPLPGHALLFASWLSLCPRPELPVIDEHCMRRFPDVPDCRLSLLYHPRNEGAYAATYLNPQHRFLSEFSLFSNGFRIEIGNDFQDDITRYRPPFDHGFRELQYQVLQTTNLNRMQFPLRTVLKHFSANWRGKTNDDLYVARLTEISVKRINFSATDLSQRALAPSQLFALDARPPNLPKDTTVNYVVVNDQWRPVSDPEISRRAKMYWKEE